MYTSDKDITEPLSDGSGVKVVVKAGTPIAWATARALGLVEGDEPKKSSKKKDALEANDVLDAINAVQKKLSSHA